MKIGRRHYIGLGFLFIAVMFYRIGSEDPIAKELFKTDTSPISQKTFPTHLPKAIDNDYNHDTQWSFAPSYTYSNEPTHNQIVPFFYYVSLQNRPINIYINGMDFTDAESVLEMRHLHYLGEWRHFYSPLSNQNVEGVNIVYSWDPALGIMDRTTDQLQALLYHLLKENPNKRVNLIAHSQGGNLAKRVMARLHYQSPSLTPSIRLYTLNTPHYGIEELRKLFKPAALMGEVALGFFSNPLNPFEMTEQMHQSRVRMFSPAYNQLTVYHQNGFLQDLNHHIIKTGLNRQIECLYTDNDSIVSYESALEPDMCNHSTLFSGDHDTLIEEPPYKLFELIKHGY
jgi:hypothetical protein